MYKALLGGQRRAHNREVAQLEERIAGLERELEERPEKPVERWHGADEIQAARDEAQRAFRSREKAFQALCMIRLLHREASHGKCRCGQPYSECEEAELVGHYPALMKWERQQWERHRDYLDCALPDGHPALTDPRWQPDE
jgi:hypothetical protein